MKTSKTASSKLTRTIIVVVITALLYIFFFLAVYPALLMIERTYLIMFAVLLLGIGLLVYFMFWTRKSILEKDETYRKMRHYEALLSKETHTFYVLDAIKETKIMNGDGDAIVRYSYKCVNNPENELKRIRFNVTHDGNLVEKSLKCSVNDEDVAISEIDRLLTLDARTNKPKEPMPNILKFSIIPKEPISKGARFTYAYSYQIGKLYRHMTEPNKEYTQTLILHPTDRLKHLIEAPDGYIFDSFDVKVFDRDEIEHFPEEERIRIECYPMLTQDKKILIWDLTYPKLANIYSLYFRTKLQN
jgi:Ca2+/Na+ antiporter